MKRILFIFAAFALPAALFAGGSAFKEDKNIPYTQKDDAYAKSRCMLDIRAPIKAKNFATLVWFHGGGLSSGNKHYPKGFDAHDIAVVAVNYRLSPKIKAHEALDDAAEAVAWVFNNIEKYGGDKTKIFVAGHSAGGYISGMLAFAPEYLGKYGIKNTDLAGSIPLSGQMTKHFRVRKDLGDADPQYLPKIDSLAVLGNCANAAPPVCLIVGDRRIEWPARVEENELLYASVKKLGSAQIEFYELQGLNHGSVRFGFPPIASGFMKRVLAGRENSKAEKK
ncbi:MAG: alpha/beta hydrolase [Opitutales bacterium]|nr:alpha/beta hydrolase [Opitutales bacterium]